MLYFVRKTFLVTLNTFSSIQENTCSTKLKSCFLCKFCYHQLYKINRITKYKKIHAYDYAKEVCWVTEEYSYFFKVGPKDFILKEMIN